MTDDESTSELTIETTVPTGVLPDDQARNYARHILANRDPSRPGTVQLAEKVLELLDRMARLEVYAGQLEGSDDAFSGDVVATEILRRMGPV